MKVLLEIKDNKAKSLLEVLNKLSYVKTQLISSEKAKLLEEIKESVSNLKLVRKGKTKARPAKDLLDANYKVLFIPPFEKQLKRLVKKYPSLKQEFSDLIDSLEKNPRQGILLGNNCFKIRLSIASKGRGKSGGSRIITCVVISDRSVYLLAIYDKSEKASVTNSELKELLKGIPG